MIYKRFLLSAILFLLIFSSCEKIKDLVTFNINNETQITIPSQGVVQIPLIIRSPEVETAAEQSFKSNNTRADLVEAAYLTKLNLTITSPQTQNFDFLNKIKIYIKDESGKEALIASLENIPEDGSRTLELETTGNDLKPFIKQETYTIKAEASTDQVLNQDVDIKANMTFSVKAKVF